MCSCVGECTLGEPIKVASVASGFVCEYAWSDLHFVDGEYKYELYIEMYLSEL